MADNVQLNPGSGGATLRTLRDSAGTQWPVGVFAYATTLAPDANVVQVVDSTHGLPVEVLGGVAVSQDDEAALKATVHQGGLWSVDVSGTVASTQSGSWTVGLAAGTEVKLASGSTVGVTGTVAVTQPTAANLNATVVQSNAANLKVTATLAAGSTVGLASGTVVGLAPGTTVNLGTGATIDLDPNAEIKLGAGTKLIGKVAAGADTSTVYNGTAALQPKFAKIAATTSGDNIIVAGAAGARIRVLRWGLAANGDVSAKWKSGSADVTGARPLTKYASAGGAYCPVGCFETAGDAPLVLNLSAAVAVGGELTYVLVPDLG